MSVSHISRSLLVFSLLAGFTAMANAGPHAAHDLHGIAPVHRPAIPWGTHSIAPYPVNRSAHRFSDGYYWERNRSPWDIPRGTGVYFGRSLGHWGLYRGDAYGHFGINRYTFYDHGWDSSAHAPNDHRRW